jgi:hypothetical protein
LYIIQIIYNICEIIKNKEIQEYLLENSQNKGTYIYYILETYKSDEWNESDISDIYEILTKIINGDYDYSLKDNIFDINKKVRTRTMPVNTNPVRTMPVRTIPVNPNPVRTRTIPVNPNPVRTRTIPVNPNGEKWWD